MSLRWTIYLYRKKCQLLNKDADRMLWNLTDIEFNVCLFIFYRLSPQLSQEVMLDEVSDAVLVDMLWETQMYLYEKREVLQSVAKLLQQN